MPGFEPSRASGRHKRYPAVFMRSERTVAARLRQLERVTLSYWQKSGIQAVRYVLVGIVVYGVDLGTFVALNWAAVAPATANITAKVVSALCGFVLHGSFTFAETETRRASQGRPTRLGFERFVRYCALLVFNAAGTTLLLVLALEYLRWRPVPTRIGVDAISIVVAFLVSKHLVFARR